MPDRLRCCVPAIDRERAARAGWRLVLVLLAALALARSTELIGAETRAELLRGHSERRWLEWASPSEFDAAATFAAVPARLRPDEPFVLALPRRTRPGWWRVMVSYHVPGHELVAVHRRPLPPLPGGTAIVVVRAGVRAEVRRAREVRHGNA